MEQRSELRIAADKMGLKHLSMSQVMEFENATGRVSERIEEKNRRDSRIFISDIKEVSLEFWENLINGKNVSKHGG